jgi:hypothetical protein
MSSLKDQVNKLREQNVQAQPLSWGRASLFSTPNLQANRQAVSKEAAAISVDEIYDAAANGLRELQQYDNRFGKFFETLLSPSSISSQRELMNKEVTIFHISS